MSANRNFRRFRWVFCATTIAVCGVLIFIFGSLLFIQLEQTYLLTPDWSDDVAVIRLIGTSVTISGGQIAVDYVVRFSSGNEKTVSFPPATPVVVGDRLRLRFAQTRITGQILVREFHRIPEPEP